MTRGSQQQVRSLVSDGSTAKSTGYHPHNTSLGTNNQELMIDLCSTTEDELAHKLMNTLSSG